MDSLSLSLLKQDSSAFGFSDFIFVLLSLAFGIIIYRALFYYLAKREWIKGNHLFERYLILFKLSFLFLFMYFIYDHFLLELSEFSQILRFVFYFLLAILLYSPLRELFSALIIFLNRSPKLGELIEYDSIIGRFKGQSLFHIILESKEGNELYIPNSLFLNRKFSHIRKQSKEDTIQFSTTIIARDGKEALRILKEASYASPYLNYSGRNKFLFSKELDRNLFEVTASLNAKKSQHRDLLESDIRLRLSLSKGSHGTN